MRVNFVSLASLGLMSVFSPVTLRASSVTDHNKELLTLYKEGDLNEFRLAFAAAVKAGKPISAEVEAAWKEFAVRLNETQELLQQQASVEKEDPLVSLYNEGRLNEFRLAFTAAVKAGEPISAEADAAWKEFAQRLDETQNFLEQQHVEKSDQDPLVALYNEGRLHEFQLAYIEAINFSKPISAEARAAWSELYQRLKALRMELSKNQKISAAPQEDD